MMVGLKKIINKKIKIKKTQPRLGFVMFWAFKGLAPPFFGKSSGPTSPRFKKGATFISKKEKKKVRKPLPAVSPL